MIIDFFIQISIAGIALLLIGSISDFFVNRTLGTYRYQD